MAPANNVRAGNGPVVRAMAPANHVRAGNGPAVRAMAPANHVWAGNGPAVRAMPSRIMCRLETAQWFELWLNELQTRGEYLSLLRWFSLQRTGFFTSKRVLMASPHAELAPEDFDPRDGVGRTGDLSGKVLPPRL